MSYLRRTCTRLDCVTISHSEDARLKGALGELTAQAVLTELGFYVFAPIFEGGSVDLCAFKDDWLYRVQVKYISLGSRSTGCPTAIRFDFNKTRNKNLNITHRYSNIDLYLVLLSNGTVLFIPNKYKGGTPPNTFSTTLTKALEANLDMFPEKQCGVYVGLSTTSPASTTQAS